VTDVDESIGLRPGRIDDDDDNDDDDDDDRFDLNRSPELEKR